MLAPALLRVPIDAPALLRVPIDAPALVRVLMLLLLRVGIEGVEVVVVRVAPLKREELLMLLPLRMLLLGATFVLGAVERFAFTFTFVLRFTFTLLFTLPFIRGAIPFALPARGAAPRYAPLLGAGAIPPRGPMSRPGGGAILLSLLGAIPWKK